MFVPTCCKILGCCFHHTARAFASDEIDFESRSDKVNDDILYKVEFIMKNNQINRFFYLTFIVYAFVFSQKTYSEVDHQWMDIQIQSQLALFPKITQQQLDSTENLLKLYSVSYARFKIINSKLEYTYNSNCNSDDIRLRSFTNHLTRMSKKSGFPDVDFILALGDAFSEDFISSLSEPAPIFCISKHDSQKKVIVFPELFRYPHENSLYINVSQNSPTWKHKQNLVFWRGSTTGGYFRPDNYQCYLRTRFVKFCKNYPKIFNCSFSDFLQGSTETEQIMRKEGLFGNNLSQKKQTIYKYLVAIDGNTCASSLWWELFSHSLIFKNKSEWKLWFDGGLIPNEHYIPFKTDFSDLIEKINWAKTHDAEAHKIAEQAYIFGKNNVFSKYAELYVIKLLEAYSKLLH